MYDSQLSRCVKEIPHLCRICSIPLGLDHVVWFNSTIANPQNVVSATRTGAHQHALARSFGSVVLDVFLQLSDDLPACSKV